MTGKTTWLTLSKADRRRLHKIARARGLSLGATAATLLSEAIQECRLDDECLKCNRRAIGQGVWMFYCRAHAEENALNDAASWD